ncbi:hypothetical protein GCM10027578_27860 [Spirosoma luteolum]
MTIEVTTDSQTAPFEVLDLQVSTPRVLGSLRLSIDFLYRSGRANRHLNIPSLTWFDASQLQRFSQELAVAQYPENCQVDLIDAGIRLTGSVRRLAGRWTTGRTVFIEPLDSALLPFTPFTIHASLADVTTYSKKLYTRLWEVFTRG